MLDVGQKACAKGKSRKRERVRKRRRYNKLKNSTIVMNTWKKKENKRTLNAKGEREKRRTRHESVNEKAKLKAGS